MSIPVCRKSIARRRSGSSTPANRVERIRTQPAGLADEHGELRPLLGQAEHRVDHGLGAIPVGLLALERLRDLEHEPFARRRRHASSSASFVGK